MLLRKDLGFNVRPYRNKYMKDYINRMSSDIDTVLYDDNVADVLVAQGYGITASPRSLYSVDQLYDALSLYAPKNKPTLIHDQHVKDGIKLAYRLFARSKSQPFLDPLILDYETALLVTSNRTGSAGLTNFGFNKAESVERAVNRGQQILDGEKIPEPCIAYYRTQFNNKTRLVWGYPYSMTLLEGLVAKPLIDHFKEAHSSMAFAITTGALGTKLRVASYHKEWAYSLDMSKFDSSIHSDLLQIAFSILRTWFNPTGEVKNLFSIIQRYFVYTPIVMPDGNLYLGKSHGVPSGSYFTQLIDSIVNVILAGAVSSRFSLHVDKREIFVLGDDLLMWSNRKVHLNQIASYVTSTMGITVHGIGKSTISRYSEPVEFLGRIWTRGLPTIPQGEILKRMVYPERFRKYSDDPVQRAKQVRLLILSYAAVYWDAWSIAERLYGGGGNRRAAEIIDMHTYSDSDRQGFQEGRQHLTGLQRYLEFYVRQRIRRVTTTALLYWM